MPSLHRLLALILVCGTPLAAAQDWPMYRGDAARSGFTDAALPSSMTRKWSYHPQHPPASAWPRDERMDFDRVFHVAVAHGCVYFGSSADGKVYALDASSGEERWSFFTNSPVRFAPAVWRDRLFAVSDDGYLYCLNARDGTLINKWRGGPDDTQVLGNGVPVSKWPARGGPAIRDDILYWAAGIWQSDGVFLIAMNPATGEVLWNNSTAATIDMPQPHGGANARSGVTAQGYLVATDDQLFVPTGRAVPAALARADGEFQYYRLQENGQRGGTRIMACGPFFYNGGFAFEAATGAVSPGPVLGVVCRFSDGILHGVRDQLRALTPIEREALDRTGQPITRREHQVLWEVASVPAGTALIAAGSTIISAGDSRIGAVDAETRELLWTAEVDATAHGLAVADGCLYVSTASGAIHCFAAAAAREPVVHRPQPVDQVAADPQVAAAAEEIVRRSGIRTGYGIDLGCGNGDLALELARRTELHIVAIDSDPHQVAAARRRLDQAGLYGARVTVQLGDPEHTHFPKQFANLVISQRSLAAGAGHVDDEEVGRLQRPYGGVACLGRPGEMQVSVRGPVENGGQWTHQYADAANTLCSTDEIRGPLTVLWFRDVDLDLPQRHGRGPAPLFHDGRLFHQGLNGLQAVDAYNGHPLWQVEQPGILRAYDADHLAGTAVTGSNFCVADSSVFLRFEDRCQRLEAATGKILATYTAPPRQDGQAALWGYLACEDGVLYGSLANAGHIVRHGYLRADAEMQQQYSESVTLFALAVESGELLWRYDARSSIRHNAIAVGGGRVFLIDRPLAEGDLLVRAGTPAGGETPRAPAPPHATGTLLALDAKTGRQLWSQAEGVFGTMLAYSLPHDLLLMCYQATRFKLPSEAGGRLAVYRSSSGQQLWEQQAKYETRPLLQAGRIIAYPTAVDLLTGEATTLEFDKSYGCGQLAGSKHLLLFRSATLSYYDSTRPGGTENYGGVRPGCWINALPVGGLILLPDASAGCKCSYQNRTWIALEGS